MLKKKKKTFLLQTLRFLFFEVIECESGSKNKVFWTQYKNPEYNNR